MLNRFLSPRLERLSAEGELATVAEASAPLLPPVVLLDRELCVFERFGSPAIGRAARAAARLYGRTAAPFDRSGFVMTPCPGGYGLWWWDLDRADALLAPRYARGLPATVPETLAQPAGTGWRQVRLASGYEAQRWDGGRLVASAWRPHAFDEAAWTNFARTAVDGVEEAPERPPAPQSLPFVASPALLLLGGRAGELRNWAQPAAAFAVALALGLGAFFAGQAVRLDALADRATAETAMLTANQPGSEVGRLRAQLARLDSFSTLLDRPDPSASLAVAIGVLQLYGQPPTSFSADGEEVRLELPYSALNVATELAGEFASAGGFRDIRVSTGPNRSSVIFEMTPPPADVVAGLPVGPARPIVAALPAGAASTAEAEDDGSGPSAYEEDAAFRADQAERRARADAARAQRQGGAQTPPATVAQPQPQPRASAPPRSATQAGRTVQPSPRPAPARDEGSLGARPISESEIPASVLEALRRDTERKRD